MSKSPNQIFRETWNQAVREGVLHESDEAVFYLGAQVAVEAVTVGGGPKSKPEYVINRLCLLLDELIRHRREMAMFTAIESSFSETGGGDVH